MFRTLIASISDSVEVCNSVGREVCSSRALPCQCTPVLMDGMKVLITRDASVRAIGIIMLPYVRD